MFKRKIMHIKVKVGVYVPFNSQDHAYKDEVLKQDNSITR